MTTDEETKTTTQSDEEPANVNNGEAHAGTETTSGRATTGTGGTSGTSGTSGTIKVGSPTDGSGVASDTEN
jgi:hypothetical protein